MNELFDAKFILTLEEGIVKVPILTKLISAKMQKEKLVPTEVELAQAVQHEVLLKQFETCQTQNQVLKDSLSTLTLRALNTEKLLRIEKGSADSVRQKVKVDHEKKNQTPLLVVTHIQKTAGASLVHFLLSKLQAGDLITFYDDWEEALAKVNASNLVKTQSARVVMGHFPWNSGVSNAFQYPVFNATILREPLDRFVSLYHFLQQIRDVHEVGRRLFDEKISLCQYAENPITCEGDNWMVRMLCDEPIASIPVDKCNQEMLEQAKRNLLLEYDLVGFTEEFGEFVKTLAAILRVDCHEIPHENATKLRTSVSSLPNQVIEALRERNKFDLQLYEFAQTMF